MINEMYAKDASKKRVLSFEMHSRRGDMKIAKSIYGYTVDKEENQLKVNAKQHRLCRQSSAGIRWEEGQAIL